MLTAVGCACEVGGIVKSKTKGFTQRQYRSKAKSEYFTCLFTVSENIRYLIHVILSTYTIRTRNIVSIP